MPFPSSKPGDLRMQSSWSRRCFLNESGICTDLPTDILLAAFTIQLKSLCNLIPRSLVDGGGRRRGKRRKVEERGGEGSAGERRERGGLGTR